MKRVIFEIFLFFLILCVGCEEQPNESNPTVSLQDTLEPFFGDIPTVQWVVYNGKEVYVGFDANYNPDQPDPLKIIMGNAAKIAHKAGHRRFELWAVDANRTGRNWKPETGIEAWMLTKITHSGIVIHTQ